ncbi:MAG TPA: transporter [Burkholderiales bacterium]|jgi:hypothetical protein|nr:transporter [Burkholderiales bacterium]
MQPDSLLCATCFLTLIAAVLPASCRAAHPFITDDAGTQGAGNWQLELLGERDRLDRVADPGSGPVQTSRRSTVLNPVLTRGLLENLDLALGLNYARYRTAEDGIVTVEASGMSDSTLELKWRFYERDGVSFALKPGIQLPTGDEDRGLGTGRASWGVNLIADYEAGPWALFGNVAYFRQRFRLQSDRDANREDLWRISGGATYQISEHFWIAGEMGARTNSARNDVFLPGGTGRFAMLGAIYSPTDKIDLDVGLRKRLNDAESTTTFLIGATFRW